MRSSYVHDLDLHLEETRSEKGFTDAYVGPLKGGVPNSNVQGTGYLPAEIKGQCLLRISEYIMVPKAVFSLIQREIGALERHVLDCDIIFEI